MFSVVGSESNDIAAKQSETRLKFCGQAFGISSGVGSCRTDWSCLSLKPLVTRPMISIAVGTPVPFVPSAQKRASLSSYTSPSLAIETSAPIPNCLTELVDHKLEETDEQTNVVRPVQKQLRKCQEHPCPDRCKNAHYKIDLTKTVGSS